MIKISTLENDKTYNVTFTLNPALEFIYALYAIAEEDYLIETCQELNFTPQGSVLDVIKDMKSKLSRFLKSELDYFFEPYDFADGGIGLIAYWTTFLKNSEFKTVSEIIECVKNTEENLLLSFVVSDIVSKYTDESLNTLCCWEEVKYNANELISLVKQTNMENNEFKEKLIECLENPMETKGRFLTMLKNVYEKAYKPIEGEILNNLKEFMEKYEELFHKNPEKFVKQFLNTTLKSLTQKEYIHISYFMNISCSSWSCSSENEVWYVLGAYTHIFNSDTVAKDKILLFYKALSEEKRLNIINLLSTRPWYVYELADELNMTAATISYHLTLLTSLEIVQYERCDHRIYYSLDKEKLKELSEKVMKSLLNQ